MTIPHPCERIYALSSQPFYGDTEGTCRITGKPSEGLPFKKWVKPTFTDIASLLPGDIVSNWTNQDIADLSGNKKSSVDAVTTSTKHEFPKWLQFAIKIFEKENSLQPY